MQIKLIKKKKKKKKKSSQMASRNKINEIMATAHAFWARLPTQ